MPTKHLYFAVNIIALAVKIMRHRVAQALMGDVMGGINMMRGIAARQLMCALRARFHPRQTARNGKSIA